MTDDTLPSLVVDRKPYALRSGDRIIYDSRNGTVFVHNAEDDDVYFRVGDHMMSRHSVGSGLTKEQAGDWARKFALAAQLTGDVKEVEGSFPSLFTYLIMG